MTCVFVVSLDSPRTFVVTPPNVWICRLTSKKFRYNDTSDLLLLSLIKPRLGMTTF